MAAYHAQNVADAQPSARPIKPVKTFTSQNYDDVRDRMEEVGNSAKGLDDIKFLLGDYTTKEEINAHQL